MHTYEREKRTYREIVEKRHINMELAAILVITHTWRTDNADELLYHRAHRESCCLTLFSFFSLSLSLFPILELFVKWQKKTKAQKHCDLFVWRALALKSSVNMKHEIHKNAHFISSSLVIAPKMYINFHKITQFFYRRWS